MKVFWERLKEKLNKETVVAVGLNLLIGVLLLLVFVQCGVYLDRYSYTRLGDEDIPFDMRMLSVSAQESDRSLGTEWIQPAEIAVSVNGTARSVLNASGVLTELYGVLTPILSDCLASEPKPVDSSAWRSAVTAPDVIYIRYAGYYPYQILHAFLADNGEEDAFLKNALAVDVCELCLSFGEETATVTLRGKNGVYVFTAPLQEDPLPLFAYPDTYRDAFYTCTLSDTVPGGAVTVTQRVDARDAAVTVGIPGQIAGNEEHMLAWLSAWQFNPDKLNSHTETDGSVVYVESHGVLWWGAEQIVYTAAEDGGVSVDEFCTPYDIDVYTYLKAAVSWINKVSAMQIQYTGGDALLRLTGVTAEDDAVTLRFGLFLDNLPVFVDGENTAVALTFRDNRVTEMTWKPVLVSKTLSSRKLFLEAWSQEMLGSEALRAGYAAEDLADGTKTVGAQWLHVRQRED